MQDTQDIVYLNGELIKAKDISTEIRQLFLKHAFFTFQEASNEDHALMHLKFDLDWINAQSQSIVKYKDGTESRRVNYDFFIWFDNFHKEKCEKTKKTWSEVNQSIVFSKKNSELSGRVLYFGGNVIREEDLPVKVKECLTDESFLPTEEVKQKERKEMFEQFRWDWLNYGIEPGPQNTEEVPQYLKEKVEAWLEERHQMKWQKLQHEWAR